MSTNDEYRAQYVRSLIEKVRDDHYPSTTHMDLIERAIPDGWLPVYLDVLIDKVAADAHPSISMLKRIGALIERIPAKTG
jgi:hypothetical protein